MNHGKLISTAWNLVWNHKWLWGLGFVAALAGGGGGGGNFNFGSDAAGSAARNSGSSDIGGVVLTFIFLLIIIAIALWVVGNIARAGLITSVNGLQEGRKSSFRSAFHDGSRFIINILGMKIAVWLSFIVFMGLIIGVIAIIFRETLPSNLSNPFLLTQSLETLIGRLLYIVCGLACLFVILVIPLAFIDAYAFRGIVLHDLGIIESIKHGWSLFRNRLGDNLILGLIYGAISLAVSLIVGMILVQFAFLAANPISDLFSARTISTGEAFALAIGGLIFTVLTALLNSVLIAFQSAGFTLAYREITGLAVNSDFEKTPDDLDSGGFI